MDILNPKNYLMTESELMEKMAQVQKHLDELTARELQTEMVTAQELITKTAQKTLTPPIMTNTTPTLPNLKNVLDNQNIDIEKAVSALNLNVNVDNLNESEKRDIGFAFDSLITCNTCNGEIPKCSVPYKTIINVKDGKVKAESIKCPLRKAWQIMRNSGVPKRYLGLRTKDYKVTTKNKFAAQAAVNCIDSCASLFISGDVRTGKTLLSCIICNERAFLGKHSLFVTVTDLMDTLQDFTDQFSRNESLRRFKSCPCLVIDDLGAEYQSDYSASVIFSIIDYRYKNNLQTIINSNFSLDELSRHLRGYQGERICRRINDFCQVIYI